MNATAAAALVLVGTFALLVLVHLAPGWWRTHRERVECFHHDHHAGGSWITAQLVDMGRRKIFTCTHCGKVWIV